MKACSHGLLTSSAVSLRFTFLGEGEGVVSKCFSLPAGPARGGDCFPHSPETLASAYSHYLVCSCTASSFAREVTSSVTQGTA